ncbi:MAG: DUF2779 domain-containing protein, partial [Pseudomonadota bacterium]
MFSKTAELSYADLDIGEGGKAMLDYLRTIKNNLTNKEKEKIFKDLLIYCGLETLAMVKLLEVLIK